MASFAKNHCAMLSRSQQLVGTSEKGKWADWSDEEETDASTSACQSGCSSDDESNASTFEAAPKMPPGQFSSGASSPVTMPGNAQVFLMPVIMNGVQVFMPMVPAQGLCVSVGNEPQPTAAEPVDDRTTLMFRNVPKSYTRSDLLKILDDEGFGGSYCFIYVPTDFKSFAGFGYGFVAFHQHEEAVRAKAHFQGFCWKEAGVQSCDVAWSGPVQGQEQHVERYRNSPVMHPSVPDEYKPAVFAHGQRIPFPAPTKAIRPPRLRHGIAGAVLTDSSNP